MSGGNDFVNVLATLMGLAAIITGLGGILANVFYGEGYLALAGLAVSLAALALGLILFYGGLRGLWRYWCSQY
jgi:phosphoglycerol transferase MdoB-like AlkP superfamily enzyme